jgi:hypothetical protein
VTRRDAGSSTTEPSIGGSLALAAGAAAAELPAQSRDVGEKFSSIAARLGAAVEELQELSRGVHPAILSDAGLGPALEALALRSPITVALEVMTEERFPEAATSRGGSSCTRASAPASSRAPPYHGYGRKRERI